MVAQFAEGSACPLMGGSCAETQCKARWMRCTSRELSAVSLFPSPISPPSLPFPSLLLLPLLPFSFFSLLCLLLLSFSLGRQNRDRQDLKAEQGEMDRGGLQENSPGLGCECAAYFLLTIFHQMSFQPLVIGSMNLKSIHLLAKILRS